MKKLAILIGLSSFLLAYPDLPYDNINTIKTNKKFEPSGVTLIQNNLYSVSDNGRILSYNLNSKKETYFEMKNKDYEDITLSTNKNLFLVEEGKDNIIELDDSLTILNKFDIDRTFNNDIVLEKDSDGLESLSFVKETEDNLYFYSANQSDEISGNDKSAIFLLEINKNSLKGKIIEYFPMNIKDISSIDYKNDNLIYFISDTENKLYLTNKEFKDFKIYNLPGKNQEGVYLDEDNLTLYIAQDSGDILEIKLNKDLK